MSFRQLRKFSKDELLFDEKESRVILKFIFKATDHKLIDSMTMTDTLRSFAQGLLVEAIDASYKIGYVESIFRASANPNQGAIKILKSFAKKAAVQWFKNTKAHDLQNVKVYQFVLDFIATRFRSQLPLFIAKNTPENNFGAFLAYQSPPSHLSQVWG